MIPVQSVKNEMFNNAPLAGNLRNMAIDMGTEVENQNSQLEETLVKAVSNEIRVKSANERAGKLL